MLSDIEQCRSCRNCINHCGGTEVCDKFDPVICFALGDMLIMEINTGKYWDLKGHRTRHYTHILGR